MQNPTPKIQNQKLRNLEKFPLMKLKSSLYCTHGFIKSERANS